MVGLSGSSWNWKKKTTKTRGIEAEQKKNSNSRDRSSHFARREAAKVLRCVIEGDAQRNAIASIKSIVYGPSVRNKKATFALVCQTLKHLPIIKNVLEISNLLTTKWKRQQELMYIITYDILFGQVISAVGAPEKFLLLRKDALQSALAELCDRRKVKSFKDLILLDHRTPEYSKPRYVRVNTLKMDPESAFHELGKQYTVKKDDMVPNLLVLPPGTDLHDHPLVMNGSVFLQGKASCMVAAALGPEPGWEVLDACSAPGNKTVHLAALMGGNGKIVACELNKERAKRLEETIKLSGASNVQVLHGDFLNISAENDLYSKVRAILLDPSCSGSGTATERLDHLLPSYTTAEAANLSDTHRIKKLAAFQRKALAHALSFPAVERVVYSTCSIHQTENEDVVKSVLQLAASLDFQLETPFPEWPRRGFPVFDGAEHLLRTDPVVDMEGFFIALFVKKKKDEPDATKKPVSSEDIQSGENSSPQGLEYQRKGLTLCSKKKSSSRRKSIIPSHFARMSNMMMLHAAGCIHRRSAQTMGCRYPADLSYG